MRDYFELRSYWKLFLATLGVIILVTTLVYSNYLANRLAENEKNNIELFVEALKSVIKDDNPNDDITIDQLILEKIGSTSKIPIILESDQGNLEGWNYADTMVTDQDFLSLEIDKFLDKGLNPIKGPPGYADHIYYKNSRLLSLIRYFPLVTVLLLSVFILFGYYFLDNARKSEQNRVWAGMAKETAHQLGTPISAIMAWIEHLKEIIGHQEGSQEVIDELTKDVNRLDLIADRFSKIGSAPKLIKINLYEELAECKNYMQKRASSKIVFDFDQGDPKHVMINQHLFDWVIENLLRNALDAMGGTGIISTMVYEENDYFCVDLSDTGKGIPSSKFRTVFQPGYSTKQRGWGLGLSLAKRIIENYHSGKIYVKNSIPDKGTTFTIKLPKAN